MKHSSLLSQHLRHRPKAGEGGRRASKGGELNGAGFHLLYSNHVGLAEIQKQERQSAFVNSRKGCWNNWIESEETEAHIASLPTFVRCIISFHLRNSNKWQFQEMQEDLSVCCSWLKKVFKCPEKSHGSGCLRFVSYLSSWRYYKQQKIFKISFSRK